MKSHYFQKESRAQETPWESSGPELWRKKLGWKEMVWIDFYHLTWSGLKVRALQMPHSPKRSGNVCPTGLKMTWQPSQPHASSCQGKESKSLHCFKKQWNISFGPHLTLGGAVLQGNNWFHFEYRCRDRMTPSVLWLELEMSSWWCCCGRLQKFRRWSFTGENGWWGWFCSPTPLPVSLSSLTAKTVDKLPPAPPTRFPHLHRLCPLKPQARTNPSSLKKKVN